MLGTRFREGLLCFVLSLALAFGSLADDQSLPDDLTTAILVKLLQFNERACRTKSIRIHVVDQSELAKSIRKFLGTRIGEGQLVEVTIGGDLPVNGTDVIVFGVKRDISEYIEYAQEHSALSVSNVLRGVESGASLAIYDDEGFPGVILNHESSTREGQRLKPGILEIAELFEE